MTFSEMPLRAKLFLLVLMLGLAIAFGIGRPSSTSVGPPNPCIKDWSKCSSNSDMANNYDGWSSAKSACKRQANDQAKYGEPEWPWIAFGGFWPGTDYVHQRHRAIAGRRR